MSAWMTAIVVALVIALLVIDGLYRERAALKSQCLELRRKLWDKDCEMWLGLGWPDDEDRARYAAEYGDRP